MSTTTQPVVHPHLIRALGRRDLVLLFVVAVFNLNVVPSIAANGGATIWLWIISLLLFFWPQGIAVIELAHRYPGEGGVYLWAKEVFGDFHGFLSGWCYWTNNMLYVPTVMLYFVGVSVYVLGPSHLGLADNKFFASTTSLFLLALLTFLNIVGLGVGKWINNLGAIGTFIAAAVLIGLGMVMWSRFGTTITVTDFKIPSNPRFVLNSFGVICFGLVGLELASVMGDEIKDPARTLPGAVAWGGVLSGALYVGATLTLLIAVGKSVNVLQGIVQAVSHMAGRVGVDWITVPFALMLSLSIAGIGSAWMGGSARIPFVAGLDSYMPSWLGKVHPSYATPYACLLYTSLGRVADPSGAVLGGVKVTAVNDSTGVARVAQTSDSGDYSFPDLPVGTYTLNFELTGFKKDVHKGIALDVNQVITLNMTMQLGAAQEVVDVTSEAPLVDTTSTQLGAVVNNRSVNELPLNARDTYQFLQLQPGVQSQLGSSGGTFYGSDDAGAVSVLSLIHI